MFSCKRKFLHVTSRFILCQEISSCDRNFLPVTRNFFKRQEISSSGIKALTEKGTLFWWQENFLQYFIPSDIKTRNNTVIVSPGLVSSFGKFYFFYLLKRLVWHYTASTSTPNAAPISTTTSSLNWAWHSSAPACLCNFSKGGEIKNLLDQFWV